MKCVRWIALSLLLIFIIGTPLTASALDTGLATEPLSEERKAEIIERREFEKLTSYTPLRAKSFDVREDHMVVIGASSGLNAYIVVYDSQGAFQYGFKTDEAGSFRVMWKENSVAFYSLRGSTLFEINEDGKITDVCRVVNSTDNSVYDQKVLASATRKVGDSTYKMTNESAIVNTFSSSFKKITKSDAQGTTVIYDASTDFVKHMILGIVAFLIISGLFVLGTLKGIKKIRENTMR